MSQQPPWPPEPPPPHDPTLPYGQAPYGQAPYGQAGDGAPTSPGRRNSAALIAVLGVVFIVMLAIVAFATLVLVGRDSSSTAKATAVSRSDAPTGPTSGEPGSTLDRPDPVVGFREIGGDDKGFALLVPTDWSDSDLTLEAIDQLVDQAGEARPELAAALEQFKAAAGQGGMAIAYGDSAVTSTGAAPVIALLSVPAGPLTVEQIVGQLSLGLGAVDAEIVSRTPVTVDGNDAIRLVIKAEVAPGQSSTQQQLIMVEDGKAYVLSVSGLDDESTAVVQESLRVR